MSPDAVVGVWFAAMLTLAIYFLLGLAILAGVDVKRGRRRALRKAGQA